MCRQLRFCLTLVVATLPIFVLAGVNTGKPDCKLGQGGMSGGFVSCERFKKIRVNKHGHTVQSLCFMEKNSRIFATGHEIDTQKLDHVIGMIYDFNKKVHYLPEKVHKKFPHLRGISAQSCSLRAISKNNFAKLPSLSALLLNDNRITAITSDTFRDNINLMFIDLKDNQIQFICENAFDHLNVLIRTHVNLERNICINESFTLHPYGWDHKRYNRMITAIQSNCTNFL